MNKFVKRELEKVSDLLPAWDETTTHLVIENENVAPMLYNVGDKFTIRVENYIINQPVNFSLAENWNGGTVPPEEILDVEIVQLLGKMLKVKAIGKCTHIAWEGWLPTKGFRIQ